MRIVASGLGITGWLFKAIDLITALFIIATAALILVPTATLALRPWSALIFLSTAVLATWRSFEYVPIFLQEMDYYAVSTLELRQLREAEKHCRKFHEIYPGAITLLLPDEDPEIALQTFNVLIHKGLIQEPEEPVLVFAGYTVSDKGRDVLARHKGRKV
nr:hypothetical protein [Chromobacterium sp. ASV5]